MCVEGSGMGCPLCGHSYKGVVTLMSLWLFFRYWCCEASSAGKGFWTETTVPPNPLVFTSIVHVQWLSGIRSHGVNTSHLSNVYLGTGRQCKVYSQPCGQHAPKCGREVTWGLLPGPFSACIQEWSSRRNTIFTSNPFAFHAHRWYQDEGGVGTAWAPSFNVGTSMSP